MWIWLTFAIVAVVIVLYLRSRGEKRREALAMAVAEQKRRDEASNKWAAEQEAERRRRQEDEENYRQQLAAATLYGLEGESVADAAVRLGIEIRYKGKHEWLGRRGEIAYTVEFPLTRSEPDKEPQAVFRMLDLRGEGEVAQVKRLFGLNLATDFWSLNAGDTLGGFKVLAAGDRDLPYQWQRYDGDFQRYVTLVDPLGRRFEVEDRGGVSYSGWNW